MINKLLNFFRPTFYVQIWEKRIRVSDIGSGNVINELPQVLITKDDKKVIGYGNKAQVTGNTSELINPFSHPRSLLSNFIAAEKLLQLIFKDLSENRFIKFSPRVVIHPMEKLEGGLTQVEIRALREMVIGAGARDTAIYTGKELPLYEFNFESIQKNALTDNQE